MNQEGRHTEIAVGLTGRNSNSLFDWGVSRHCAATEDWCGAFGVTRVSALTTGEG